MENDNLIFQNSIFYNQLPDEITRKAVKEFVLTQNDYPNKKRCLSTLCKGYPRNLSVEKFTSKNLLSTIRFGVNQFIENVFSDSLSLPYLISIIMILFYSD